MTTSEAIEILRANKKTLEKEFGLKSIGLLGSYARNEMNPDSDIDVLVELSEPKYKYLFGIKSLLEAKFKLKVDVVLKSNYLRDSFQQSIKNEIIYAYQYY